MTKWTLTAVALVVVLMICGPASAQTETPTPLDTPTDTPVPTNTFTPTVTPTPSHTPPPAFCSARTALTHWRWVTLSLTGTVTHELVGPPGDGNRVFVRGIEATSTGATVATIGDGTSTMYRADFAGAGRQPYAEYTFPKCGAIGSSVTLAQTGAGTVVVSLLYGVE